MIDWMWKSASAETLFYIGTWQMSGTQLLFGVQLAFRMQRHKNANSLILNLSHEVVVRTFGIDVSKSRIKPD